MVTHQSTGIRAPIERLYVASFKAIAHEKAGSEQTQKSDNNGKFGNLRVLPPHLSEMGMEIRHHLWRVEPWLRCGWKTLTKRPAFYPTGTTIDAPDFFAEINKLFASHYVVASRGGFLIPPSDYGEISCNIEIQERKGILQLAISEVQKFALQSHTETQLRQIFLDWFGSDQRWISDFDHDLLSFDGSARGNFEYRLAAALPPTFLPPTFENPPEPIPPHVGVQMRKFPEASTTKTRNSDAKWMLSAAQEIADHLGIDLMVYGHPNGCFLPETGFRTSFDPARPQGQMARELGYLKSCRLMLAPDSGWADLMAWLQIPTLLEKQNKPGTFSNLKAGFRPKLRIADRERPIGPQADELIAAEGPVFPDDAPPLFAIDPATFPWAP